MNTELVININREETEAKLSALNTDTDAIRRAKAQREARRTTGVTRVATEVEVKVADNGFGLRINETLRDAEVAKVFDGDLAARAAALRAKRNASK